MQSRTRSKMCAFYLLRSSSGVHRYGVDKLRRDTADRGANRDVRRGTVIGTVLVLALADVATAGQSCRIVQGHCPGLDTWDDTQGSVKAKQWGITAAAVLVKIHHRHQRLMVVSRCESSLHRPSCAFRRPWLLKLSNSTCTHKVNEWLSRGSNWRVSMNEN